ncbi:hypothetical protein [Natrarchaeobius halalkaliphilus]|nr:hypothetical protein [Natrarchaeobius halalkaliphilus]
MCSSTSLPRIDDCLELYLIVTDRHGTSTFTRDDINQYRHIEDVESLLELGVAYGLFAVDSSQYRIRCEPDASRADWQEATTERATTIQRTISNRLESMRGSGAVNGSVAATGSKTTVDSDTTTDSVRTELQRDDGREVLQHESDRYTSVFVSESDGFDAVFEALVSVPVDDCAGVVLRAPGEYASHVQRFADRLCTNSIVDESSLSTSYRKEYSDVVGDDKNELEFRLFLRELST